MNKEYHRSIVLRNKWDRLTRKLWRRAHRKMNEDRPRYWARSCSGKVIRKITIGFCNRDLEEIVVIGGEE